MMEWKRISEVPAPKDGTIINLGWAFEGEDKIQEWFTMRWVANGVNGLFPGLVGIWIAPDNSCTWNDEDDEGAPTHWKEVDL